MAIYSGPDFEPKASYLSVKQEYFKTFSIRACMNVSIILTQYPNFIRTKDYEVQHILILRSI